MLKYKSPKDQRKVKKTIDTRIGFIGILLIAGILFTAFLLNSSAADAAGSGASIGSANTTVSNPTLDSRIAALPKFRNTTNEQRRAAAIRNIQERMRDRTTAVSPGYGKTSKTMTSQAVNVATITPGGMPDYFGTTPNFANSPAPIVDPVNMTITGGIRKFVDSLPGLYIPGVMPVPIPNDIGQYLPVAIPDTVTYSGSDYYVIELGQYTEQLHKDLPPTTLRGYRQINTNDPNVSRFSYLGPVIVAQKDRPVRVKFINNLPTGAGGNLFIPVDPTVMGAGMGPLYPNSTTCNPMMAGSMCANYTQNRATLHLHGGNTPWISDGTQHQWVTPANESTPYPKGVSARYVPDMDNGTEPNGTLTFYYTNQQGARLMWYHDHAYGITRLNVYAGEVAPYLLQDSVEQTLITGGNITMANGTNLTVAAGTIPDLNHSIPLVIQDKAFVDASKIGSQDPTWNWGTTPGVPRTGDLWFPHVYMPNQNPYNPIVNLGMNAMGRWDYAPWFWPPTPITYGPVPNPLYGTTPQEGPVNPGIPNPSIVPEAYMDTPLVNGNAYPNLTVGQSAYRFWILNGANDRMLNLQLYYASTAGPFVVFSGGNGSGASATATVNAAGMVTGIMLTSGGAGFTAPPNVTILDAPGHKGTGSGATANATGSIQTINVTASGSGYTNPVVNIIDLTGSGATAHVSMMNVISINPLVLGISAISVDTPGSNYTAPVVSITDPTGSGANATALMNVTGIKVVNPGSGYTIAPVVKISGGNGSGAAATAIINATGSVIGFNITSGGSGYTTAPNVNLIGTAGLAAGSGATANATIDLDPASPTYGSVIGVILLSSGSGYQVPTLCNNATVPINPKLCTEVSMVPACPACPGAANFPASWRLGTPGMPPDILDGRAGGVPDPAAIGPQMIQIGTEGGFLPAPAIIESRPVGYEKNTRSITITNVLEKALYLGPAERADVIVNFTGVPNGSTLILYNDAPAPMPAFDPRNDYYTNDIDNTLTGGAPSTIPGYGPNTRTIMQIQINNASGNTTTFNMTNLTTALPAAYGASQPVPLVPQGVYDVPFNATYQTDTYAAIQDTSMTFLPAAATQPVRSLNLTNGGTNYATAPTVNINGGGGTNATANAIIGFGVASVTVTNGGSGYSTPPAVTISAPTLAGGIRATATATVASGRVTAIVVNNPGSGYTSAPTVTIAPPPAGTRARATASLATGGSVMVLVLTNGGSGYTSNPAVNFTGGGGSGAAATASINLTMQFQPKAIQELFEIDYGRMNAMLGVELPNTNQLIQTMIPYLDIDPPTEVINNSIAAVPLGTLGDGTQIWKITHNGVDTHPVHWHMFNVQLINRVGWDGAIKPPDANEVGWKETIRMNPLEDVIIALRPITPDIPWELPNSIRPLDVTMPLGSTGQFGSVNGGIVDPTGQPVTVINHLINYGWEYLWHCHILGHEENIMMRSMLVAVAPKAPSNLTATLSASIISPRVMLAWTDSSVSETNFTIQRATAAAGPWTTIATIPSTTGPGTGTTVTYIDTTVVRRTTYYYRVIANNVVGDTTVYAAPAVGYPHVSADSTPSNIPTVTTR